MYLKSFAAVLCLTAAPALADDLVFELINDSSADLSELYVAASETDTWGEDILGLDVLAAGASATVTIPDGSAICDFDLSFVMSNDVTIEGSADLCETNSFTLQD